MIKRIALAVLAALLLLAAALAVNTWRHGSRQLDVAAAPPLAVDTQGVADTLAAAIRLPTIASRDDPDANAAEFLKLHALLQQRFPRVHASLQREIVGKYSLLYTWKGTDPSAKPVAFLAHQDVVPIAPGTEGTWKAPPFSGAIRDGEVWGRGAWDDKCNIVTQMAAVEMLLASGFQPRQTIYLAYGADEEINGPRGATQIVKLLQERQVRLDFVIDEGLLVTEGMMPGIASPVALVGVAEKGYASVVMKVKGQPGHSSMPPAAGTSAIAKMSEALDRLEHHQRPAAISGVARQLFETLAPEMHGFQRVALSNLWLFGPLVQKQLEKSATTNAMLRTTTALTIVNAGNKDNVLPGEAEATVNFRMLPGDTQQGMLQHVRETVGPDVELSLLPGGADPSPISASSAASFQAINRAVRAVFPGTLVTPGLMVAGTDSHLYQPISDGVYRFMPIRARPADLSRFHGTNERISVANLGEMVHFYHQLLRNLNAPAP
jgi:carboxypeptidase PM20D1